MRKQRLLLRKADFKVSDDQELSLLEGYAAVFNQNADIGFFTESIAEGAFSESISRGDDVAALIDHDTSKIVARTPNSLELSEDSHGLKVRITPANTSIGRDLVENIRAGNISQMSIGFYIEEEFADFQREKPHFEIRKAKLFDVSAVTFPAYQGTEISVARCGEVSEEEVAERLRPFRSQIAQAEKEKRARRMNLIRLGK